jgi:hypothetical protein
MLNKILNLSIYLKLTFNLKKDKNLKLWFKKLNIKYQLIIFLF